MALWGYGISSKENHETDTLILPSEQNEMRGGRARGSPSYEGHVPGEWA